MAGIGFRDQLKPTAQLTQLADTNLIKAAAAVDRSVVLGEERNHGLDATLGADDGVHLTRRVACTILTPLLTTSRTALGLVSEALGGIEFLLAGGESEAGVAIYALDCLIAINHFG